MEESLKQYLKTALHIKEVDARTYSPLSLAYIGDAVYDLMIRTMVVSQANMQVNKYHKMTSAFVKAQTQAALIHAIEGELTEEELAVYKRGRNAKSFTTAKNASVIDYRTATGMEALIGYLYLDNQDERMIDLVRMGLERIEK
ncbi:MAG: Mini-ribonuclease 3 [Lachnospiraceae bacterium]